MGNSGGIPRSPGPFGGEAQGSGAGPGAALLALGHRYPCWWPRAAKNLTLALWKAASSPLPSASAMTGARYKLVSIRDLMKLFFPPRPRGSACAEGSFRLCAVFFFPLFFFFTLLLLFFSLATLCKQFRCDLLFQPRGLICGAASPLSVSELNEPSHRLRALLKNKNLELLGCHG